MALNERVAGDTIERNLKNWKGTVRTLSLYGIFFAKTLNGTSTKSLGIRKSFLSNDRSTDLSLCCFYVPQSFAQTRHLVNVIQSRHGSTFCRKIAFYRQIHVYAHAYYTPPPPRLFESTCKTNIRLVFQLISVLCKLGNEKQKLGSIFEFCKKLKNEKRISASSISNFVF